MSVETLLPLDYIHKCSEVVLSANADACYYAPVDSNVRLSTDCIPQYGSPLLTSGIPFGILYTPYAHLRTTTTSLSRPPARCCRCQAYINTMCNITNTSWSCSICYYNNSITGMYFVIVLTLDSENQTISDVVGMYAVYFCHNRICRAS